MIQNKKFGFIIALFTFVPNIFIWLLPSIEKNIKGFYLSDYKNYLFLIILLSLVAPIYVYNKNKTDSKNKFWHYFSIILIILILFYLYITYSLSNIGF